MNSLVFLLTYPAVVNIVGFILMGIDKRKARLGAFRIPELTLFTVAVIGGSLGSIAGMYAFRHKTRVKRFKFGLPAILIIQLAAVVFLILQPVPIRFL